MGLGGIFFSFSFLLLGLHPCGQLLKVLPQHEREEFMARLLPRQPAFERRTGEYVEAFDALLQKNGLKLDREVGWNAGVPVIVSQKLSHYGTSFAMIASILGQQRYGGRLAEIEEAELLGLLSEIEENGDWFRGFSFREKAEEFELFLEVPNGDPSKMMIGMRERGSKKVLIAGLSSGHESYSLGNLTRIYDLVIGALPNH